MKTAHASVNFSDTVTLCNPITGKQLGQLTHANDRFGKVTWSPDGRRLAAVSMNTSQTRDVASVQERYRLPSPEGTALAVTFSPDGRYLAMGSQVPAVLL